MKKITYVGDLSGVLIGGIFNRKVKRGESVDLPESLAEELLKRKKKDRPQWEAVDTKKTRKGAE